MKTPVAIRPQYTIYFELFEGCTFAHCDVREWSAGIAKQMKQDMDILREMQGRDVFAVNEPSGCKKHQRFMQMMGFEYHCDLEAKGGGVVHVFKR